MPEEFAADPHDEPALPPRVALLSIVGFWLFYCAIVTLRSAVMGKTGQLDTLVRHLELMVFSMGLTYLLYLVLRRVVRKSLRRGMIVAGLLAAPAALAFSAADWVVFEVMKSPWPAIAASAEKAPAETEQAPPAGRMMVEVGGTNADDANMEVIKMITDNAVNSYFFFVGWAALYLALRYAAEVGALERKNAAFRAAAQAAELRALRYQVNPHFLFNTLNSLSSLVMSDRRPAAERMIINLSSFFRASLVGDPSEDVRLEEEIRLQRLYLEIEQVRFPVRLRLAIDLPDDLRDALVPGLILQPLIENAVKYGVSRSRRPVTISIRARSQEGLLLLSVQDDGEAGAAGKESVGGTGLGLRNVADRIAARFGGGGSCRVHPLDPGGFLVDLTMPLTFDAR
ncbi:histidine kinase [Sphingomonas cannabina]|uniref:sensor histidine kinase n=1 Tax=Sphingomonas cannabina TaxID=2899123 RepID=UPI001F47B368|nr:histidine kinase [Sphingomonas cannabina]UIJ44623.1 histidine kinase [Sphingomonas cannabina]